MILAGRKTTVVPASPIWIGIRTATCLLLIMASQAITAAANGQDKICVVGGGMAGSCAAFFIHSACDGGKLSYTHHEGKSAGEFAGGCKAEEEAGGARKKAGRQQWSNAMGIVDDELVSTCEVHVFEKSDAIGGRILSSLSVQDKVYEVGDLLATDDYRHVAHFVDLLNLTRSGSGRDKTRFGIFDGKAFVFKERLSDSDGGVWKSLHRIRQLWRYGFGMFTAKSFVNHVMTRFHLLQDSPYIVAYKTVAEMLDAIDLEEIAQKPFGELLKTNRWIYNIMVDEILAGATRARSGQSPSVMHGVAGGLVLAPAFDLESWTVKEGFSAIPRMLLERSHATVHLNAEVQVVSRAADGGYMIRLASNESEECSAVIIAAPLQAEEIKLPENAHLPRLRWKQLHVTYVEGLINPAYFGMPNLASLPTNIATTDRSVAPFLYISYANPNASKNDDGLFLYRVLSAAAFTDLHVNTVFQSARATWRTTWTPFVEFSSPSPVGAFLLDDHHLYNANALESVFGGMEAAAIAAENVVRLMLERMGFGEMEPESESGLGLGSGSGSGSEPSATHRIALDESSPSRKSLLPYLVRWESEQQEDILTGPPHEQQQQQQQKQEAVTESSRSPGAETEAVNPPKPVENVDRNVDKHENEEPITQSRDEVRTQLHGEGCSAHLTESEKDEL
ncbi:hypothetical protein CBR_g864 [Chara braunii]|uniref:Prenylcysteine lyase domain-containing protein n=1 Tax=Chara braunii TaxID=69332 RepID=A0A388KCK3_CHABU|nr:hypothetical protein CBR_g864 [Chara braunii]|eukprot:GBG67736.1 hypothetical protein CBR_g864 [Chara braunii]